MLIPCTEFEILDGQVKLLEIMWLLRVKQSFVHTHHKNTRDQNVIQKTFSFFTSDELVDFKKLHLNLVF